MVLNRKYILHRYRQSGESLDQAIKPTTEEVDITNIPEGSIVVRVVLLSLDPTNASWATTAKSYMPVIPIGNTFRGATIGRVIASKDEKFPVGSWVSGLGNWQDFYIGPAAAGQFFIIPFDGTTDLNIFLGLVALVGYTAYFGLFDVCNPKEGETIVVSGAAGAVGSLMGQLARLKGFRVIGIAGGPEKCGLLKSRYGYDEAIDYKNDDIDAKLKEFAPKGVDVYFDNVGGDITQAVVANMNIKGRIAVCGQISGYKNGSVVFENYGQVIAKRLRIEGFLVFDYASQFPAAAAELLKWYREGQLTYSVDERSIPFESIGTAYEDLFSGNHSGKLIMRLC